MLDQGRLKVSSAGHLPVLEWHISALLSFLADNLDKSTCTCALGCELSAEKLH